MKTVNNSKKSYSKQLAVACIIYKMAGSYFLSGEEANKFRGKCTPHYFEMPPQKRIQYEDRIITVMEALDKRFLKKIAALRCKVWFRFCEDDILMDFCTGRFEGLQCRILKNGDFRITPMPPVRRPFSGRLLIPEREAC